MMPGSEQTIVDPATNDPEMERKLQESAKIGSKKLDQVNMQLNPMSSLEHLCTPFQGSLSAHRFPFQLSFNLELKVP